MTVYMVLMVFLAFYGKTEAYVEKVVVTGCESCVIYLTCRHLDSIIAILETEFVPSQSPKVLGNNTLQGPFPPARPRDVLNQRCSGVNHCSFILRKDCPGTENWGLGIMTIKFACVSESNVRKYCNSVIQLPGKFTTGLSEGFIHNPGYPRFYSGHQECQWTIRAADFQKIKLTLLDVKLFDQKSLQHECNDLLMIKDSGQVIYSTCQQNDPPTEVISASETLEVILSAKMKFNPRRGILLHYTTVGCPTLLPPRNGFLVFKNQTTATFTCCQGHRFPDIGTKSRTVNCLGAFWDVPLPLIDCEKIAQDSQIILPSQSSRNINQTMLGIELIIPILIMIALFAVNGVVLLFIHRAKKRNAMVIYDEELTSFSPVVST